MKKKQNAPVALDLADLRINFDGLNWTLQQKKVKEKTGETYYAIIGYYGHQLHHLFKRLILENTTPNFEQPLKQQLAEMHDNINTYSKLLESKVLDALNNT